MRVWRFGDFEVDPDLRELRRGGSVVHLEPQAFDLLAYLIGHRDRVVPKAELLDGVWGHAFLSEANLTTRVKEVRRAVADDGQRQHTIRNVRGRGYRFVAAIEDAGAVAARPAPVAGPEVVGRDDEVAAVTAAVERSRLVTITGPGGVGKSTLARAVAAALSPPDGVHVVELAALAAGAAVLPSVALALDIEYDEERAADAVRSIARLDALVVLDNCEHLVEDAAALADQVVRAVGGCSRILATSQLSLAVSGEVVIPIGPLAGGRGVELFRRRAAAALPTWDDAVPAERLDRLVARLGGLPLTIEMAAARVGSMAFDDLERVLFDDAGLLQVTHRAPAPRHRSLESLLEWAAGPLPSDQRRSLLALSVFAGAVTTADAAAVLGAGEVAAALDLAGLAERSLVVADVRGTATRHRMLPTVRAVAARWLEASGGADDVRRRHAEHLAAALEDIDARLRTPEEGAARDRLASLVDEARAAHRWASEHAPELASSMSAALFHAAYSSLWSEPAEWSRSLLERHPGDGAVFPGAALLVAGTAAHRGDFGAAEVTAAAVAASEASVRLRSSAWELLADIGLYRGDLAGTTRAAEALGRLGREHDDAHARAFAVVDTALALAYGGDPSAALAAIDAAPLGALAPSDAAWLAYTRGDTLSALGSAEAVAMFAEAIALGTEVDNRFVTSVARVSLAAELSRSGDVAGALDAYADALASFRRHGNDTHAVTAIRNLIGLLAGIGDDHGAAVLAGTVSDERVRASYGAEADRIADVLEGVRRRVGPDVVDGWIAEGGGAGTDRVVVAAAIVDGHRS